MLMRTSPLDIAGGRARWISPAGDDGTWLEWTHGAEAPSRVSFAQLRWSADLLAGAEGPTWARSLPTVVQRYDHDESWIFHATRLETLHDLPCEPGGRWSVYRWRGEWFVDFHQQVACPGATMPLLVALTAVQGCGPTAIR
jgi:hypothetical protein